MELGELCQWCLDEVLAASRFEAWHLRYLVLSLHGAGRIIMYKSRVGSKQNEVLATAYIYRDICGHAVQPIKYPISSSIPRLFDGRYLSYVHPVRFASATRRHGRRTLQNSATPEMCLTHLLHPCLHQGKPGNGLPSRPPKKSRDGHRCFDTLIWPLHFI